MSHSVARTKNLFSMGLVGLSALAAAYFTHQVLFQDRPAADRLPAETLIAVGVCAQWLIYSLFFKLAVGGKFGRATRLDSVAQVSFLILPGLLFYTTPVVRGFLDARAFLAVLIILSVLRIVILSFTRFRPAVATTFLLLVIAQAWVFRWIVGALERHGYDLNFPARYKIVAVLYQGALFISLALVITLLAAALSRLKYGPAWLVSLMVFWVVGSAVVLQRVTTRQSLAQVTERLPNADALRSFQGEGPGLRGTKKFEIGGERRNAFLVEPPGRLEHKLTVSENTKIGFGFGVLPTCWNRVGDGVAVRLSLNEEGREPRVLVQRYINPKSDAQTRRWVDLEADLENWEGREVTLRLEYLASDPEAPAAKPDRRFDWVVISEPWLSSQGPKTDRPSVILYLIDTLRADRLGGYGYPSGLTPAFDRISREGWLVRDFRSTCSWTRPAVASVLTSLSPVAHGTMTEDDGLPAEATTLAEWFREKGYRTAAFVTNGHVAGKYLNFEQGFDHFFPVPRRAPFEPADAEVVTTRVLNWLDSDKSRREPFFIFVHTVDPHGPYTPPEPYDLVFDRSYSGWLRGDYGPTSFRNVTSPQIRDLRYVEALYDGEIAYADREIGRLMHGLERRGYLESTHFCVTSDHGEEFQEHGKWEHGSSLHDVQIRIPLLIRPASKFSGEVDPDILEAGSITDIFPTLTRLAEADNPGFGEGRVLIDSDPISSPGFLAHLSKEGDKHKTVFIKGDRKLDLRYEGPSSLPWAGESRELDGLDSRQFHLDSDPRESWPMPIAQAGSQSLENLLSPWFDFIQRYRPGIHIRLPLADETLVDSSFGLKLNWVPGITGEQFDVFGCLKEGMPVWSEGSFMWTHLGGCAGARLILPPDWRQPLRVELTGYEHLTIGRSPSVSAVGAVTLDPADPRLWLHPAVAAQIHNEQLEVRVYGVDIHDPDEGDSTSVMTAEDEENLRALGYIQ